MASTVLRLTYRLGWNDDRDFFVARTQVQYRAGKLGKKVMTGLISGNLFVYHRSGYTQACSIQQTTGKAQLPFMIEPRIGQSNAVAIDRQIDNPNAFTEAWCILKIAGNRWIKSAMLQDGQIESQRGVPARHKHALWLPKTSRRRLRD